jgi:RNA polymerase sigma-70 factor (ECF subfamily)
MLAIAEQHNRQQMPIQMSAKEEWVGTNSAMHLKGPIRLLIPDPMTVLCVPGNTTQTREEMLRMLRSLSEQQIRQLETQVVRGDGTAMETLFDLSHGRLSRIASFRMPIELRRTMSVDHLLMAARMRAIRRQTEFAVAAARSHFVWLRQILLHTIDVIQKRLKPEYEGTDRLPLTSAPSAAFLQSLADLDREILLLRHFEELTNQETSIITGISPQGVSTRYMNVIRELAEAPCDVPLPVGSGGIAAYA